MLFRSLYIKSNQENLYFNFKNPVELFINYNYIDKYKRNYNFDIFININAKTNFVKQLNMIKKEIDKSIKKHDIVIKIIYYEDVEKRPNVKTYMCSLRPIQNNITDDIIYPIIKIDKKDEKNVWTGRKIEHEKELNIDNFIMTYKKTNVKDLRCYPKIMPIMIIEDKYNNNNKTYIRHISIKCNMVQLIYVQDFDVLRFTNN